MFVKFLESIQKSWEIIACAMVIKLEENYRSTQHILDAASNLIYSNDKRHKKKLYTKAGQGEKIKLINAFDEVHEAKIIADEIETQLLRKRPISEIAILVRAFYQTRAFEEILTNYGIKYRIIGGLRFYER